MRERRTTVSHLNEHTSVVSEERVMTGDVVSVPPNIPYRHGATGPDCVANLVYVLRDEGSDETPRGNDTELHRDGVRELV